MKKFYISIACSLLIIFFAHSVNAQYVFENLHTQFSEGKLSFDLYLEYSALNIVAPEKVPEAYRVKQDELPLKSGTFIIQQLKENWQRLSPSTQKLLTAFFQRPVLPFSIVSQSGRFRIHFALEGKDAVNPVDNDKNGIPDYVDKTGFYFDYINHLLLDSLGYQAPPPDSGGSGKEFDVYLVQLSAWYGVTYLDETVPGNPNAWSCYMQIENDYLGFPTPPEQSLMVTSAHEYYHVVQVGYTYREEDIFFMEMCSTWMEDFAHDDVNDYLNYLPSFFARINYPFSYTDGNYEYASSLWNHMIVKKYGADVIREIWEQIPTKNAMTSIRLILQQTETSFENELANFGLWNYLTGSRCDTINFYPEGHLYPQVRIAKNIVIADEDTSFVTMMSKFSSNFYQIEDTLNNLKIGIIVTNFDIPSKNQYGNFDPSDKINFGMDIVFLPRGDSTEVSLFQRLNKLSRISDYHGVRFNISEKDKWNAKAAVFDEFGNYSVTQFFPSETPAVANHEEYIINIFPNPYIINNNTEPLFISYYTTEKDFADLKIFSSDGRLMHKQTVNTNIRFSDDLEWNCIDENGNYVASGVYIAVFRAGKHVDVKKFAIIK